MQRIGREVYLIIILVVVFVFGGLGMRAMQAEREKPAVKRADASFAALRYPYSQLSEREQALYDALYDGISAYQETVRLPEAYTRSEYERVYLMVMMQEPEFFYVDRVYELAEEVISRLSTNAEKKKITASVTGEHIVYNGSRTILDEIIYNLCDNAIKYGVENGTLDVKISHIPKKVFITVSDNGVGIPQQSVGRIFERFYRVDKSRSRKVNGTGLGLSIVKHGVMYHGGEIRCESKPDKGSVFTVELPV